MSKRRRRQPLVYLIACEKCLEYSTDILAKIEIYKGGSHVSSQRHLQVIIWREIIKIVGKIGRLKRTIRIEYYTANQRAADDGVGE